VLYQKKPQGDNMSEALQSGREAASPSEVSEDITTDDESSDTKTVRPELNDGMRRDPSIADNLTF
jgi:hypothetical protein